MAYQARNGALQAARCLRIDRRNILDDALDLAAMASRDLGGGLLNDQRVDQRTDGVVRKGADPLQIAGALRRAGHARQHLDEPRFRLRPSLRLDRAVAVDQIVSASRQEAVRRELPVAPQTN